MKTITEMQQTILDDVLNLAEMQQKTHGGTEGQSVYVYVQLKKVPGCAQNRTLWNRPLWG